MFSAAPDEHPAPRNRFATRFACFSTLAIKTEPHAAQTAEQMPGFVPRQDHTRTLTCIEFAAFHLRHLRKAVHGMALAARPTNFSPARGVERKPR